MDTSPTDGGLRLGAGARLSRSRSGQRLWRSVFIRRLRAMGIRDRPTAPRSPWQNGYCERLIGSIRGGCLDHIVVFWERHLRHLPCVYANYYNRTRTHLSLNKDSPASRAIESFGGILAVPILGGLHLSIPKISSGADSRNEAESAHHSTR